MGKSFVKSQLGARCITFFDNLLVSSFILFKLDSIHSTFFYTIMGCVNSTPESKEEVNSSEVVVAPPVGNEYLGWRQECTCAMVQDEFKAGRTEDKMEGFQEEALKIFKSDDFRAQPPCTKFEDADAKRYVEWMKERVKAVNASGGPRVRVVWFGTMEHNKQIPKYPEDAPHILDLELTLEGWLQRCNEAGEIDGRKIAVLFCSHRWNRAHWCDACITGKCPLLFQAHPDTEDHYKARTMGAIGRHIYEQKIGGHQVDHYYWIDYAGIDQSDGIEKVFGIKLLPLYISVTEQVHIFYSEEYLPRAWTQLERFVSYYTNSFNTVGAYDMAIDYDSKLAGKEVPPAMKFDMSQLIVSDPREGNITVPSDMQQIAVIMEMTESMPPVTGKQIAGVEEKKVPTLGETEIAMATFAFEEDSTC